MAINKKLIHFGKRSDFDARLHNNEIQGTSIVFIKDTQEIWTHNTFYPGEGIADKLEAIQNDFNFKVFRFNGTPATSNFDIEHNKAEFARCLSYYNEHVDSNTDNIILMFNDFEGTDFASGMVVTGLSVADDETIGSTPFLSEFGGFRMIDFKPDGTYSYHDYTETADTILSEGSVTSNLLADTSITSEKLEQSIQDQLNSFKVFRFKYCTKEYSTQNDINYNKGQFQKCLNYYNEHFNDGLNSIILVFQDDEDGSGSFSNIVSGVNSIDEDLIISQSYVTKFGETTFRFMSFKPDGTCSHLDFTEDATRILSNGSILSRHLDADCVNKDNMDAGLYEELVNPLKVFHVNIDDVYVTDVVNYAEDNGYNNILLIIENTYGVIGITGICYLNQGYVTTYPILITPPSLPYGAYQLDLCGGRWWHDPETIEYSLSSINGKGIQDNTIIENKLDTSLKNKINQSKVFKVDISSGILVGATELINYCDSVANSSDLNNVVIQFTDSESNNYILSVARRDSSTVETVPFLLDNNTQGCIITYLIISKDGIQYNDCEYSIQTINIADKAVTEAKLSTEVVNKLNGQLQVFDFDISNVEFTTLQDYADVSVTDAEINSLVNYLGGDTNKLKSALIRLKVKYDNNIITKILSVERVHNNRVLILSPFTIDSMGVNHKVWGCNINIQSKVFNKYIYQFTEDVLQNTSISEAKLTTDVQSKLNNYKVFVIKDAENMESQNAATFTQILNAINNNELFNVYVETYRVDGEHINYPASLLTSSSSQLEFYYEEYDPTAYAGAGYLNNSRLILGADGSLSWDEIYSYMTMDIFEPQLDKSFNEMLLKAFDFDLTGTEFTSLSNNGTIKLSSADKTHLANWLQSDNDKINKILFRFKIKVNGSAITKIAYVEKGDTHIMTLSPIMVENELVKPTINLDTEYFTKVNITSQAGDTILTMESRISDNETNIAALMEEVNKDATTTEVMNILNTL